MTVASDAEQSLAQLHIKNLDPVQILLGKKRGHQMRQARVAASTLEDSAAQEDLQDASSIRVAIAIAESCTEIVLSHPHSLTSKGSYLYL